MSRHNVFPAIGVYIIDTWGGMMFNNQFRI